MLFNPKWDPTSLETLIAWLETQPPAKYYPYGDADKCLAFRYNEFVGRKYDCGHIRVGTFDDTLEGIASGFPRSYGAALERARERQT